jgi:asparagine synthase (glutamine-hydrolysing)
MIDEFLAGIPWARTGRLITGGDAAPDSLSKDYHKYGEWLREDCLDLVRENLEDGTLENLGIFDMPHVATLLRAWLVEPHHTISYLTGTLSWLVSLSMICRRFGILAPVGFPRPANRISRSIRRIRGRVRQDYYLIWWRNPAWVRFRKRIEDLFTR